MDHAVAMSAPAPAERHAETESDVSDYRSRDVVHNTEAYDRIYENEFVAVKDHPLSTFGIDVDTASYSNVRRFLSHRQLPPKGAVRIEELINYFNYEYPAPQGQHPFSLVAEMSVCPWNRANRLVHIGLQGMQIPKSQVPPRNLVFLIDVSGSMDSSHKLGLLKQAFSMLADGLRESDRVAMVVYAGASGLVLPSTSGVNKQRILGALSQLRAGGSTNGGAGIRLAYQVAQRNFRKGGINRVILATDGDFNVGTTSQSDLVNLIEQKRKSGVFLTVLGFGMGNYKDSTMEKLADKGNGNYAYIDNLAEARKVLVHQVGGTLMTIAKDVKLQLEFNPEHVKAYRLIGYENRMLKAEDFNNDKKDSGELGAGHTVTALYEIVPANVNFKGTKVDPLRYQGNRRATPVANSAELMNVKLRYKKPTSDKSILLATPVQDQHRSLAGSSTNDRFSAAVAAFGMLLRGSRFKGQANYGMVRELAQGALGQDPHGYRAEFLKLAKTAQQLNEQQARR